MPDLTYIEFLNRFVRNPTLKFTDVDQLSSVQLSAGVDGFWGFVEAATKDIGGTIYDGVKKFTANLSNPDIATVESLLSMSSMVGYSPLLGKPSLTLTKDLSKLQDKLSVSRYVYEKTLDEQTFIVVPTTDMTTIFTHFGGGQPSSYVDNSDQSYVDSNMTVAQASSLEWYQTSAGETFPTAAWFYVEGQTSSVRDACGNASWPFETIPEPSSFEYKMVYDDVLDRVYVSNLSQTCWKQWLIAKFYEFFQNSIDLQRSGDIYVDPNMVAWESTDPFDTDLTFRKYEDWLVVENYKLANNLTTNIKTIVLMLDNGEIEWKDLDTLTQNACILSIRENIKNLLESGVTKASYAQWKNISNLCEIISALGFSKNPDIEYASMRDLSDSDKTVLMKSTAEILANYSLAFQYDRQMVRHQIASYAMAGTDRMLERTIVQFIEDNIRPVNEYGVEITYQDSSVVQPDYVFSGKVNIIKWLDTIDYNNIAQLDEVLASGKPKSNSDTVYNQKYFASVLGYPYLSTQTDSTWILDQSVPQHIRSQASSLAVSTTMQSRYWEDDSSLFSNIQWSDILAFYRNLGVGEKNYENYAAYSASDVGLIVKTVSTTINGSTVLQPYKLLSQNVIDNGLILFPDIENDETQTSSNRADRGLFYYIMYVHQLGAAKGKADIDSISSSTTWQYYKAYSGAKQNPKWFMSMENINHMSFKPLSYIVAISKKAIEQFATDTVVLMSFATPSALAEYLQTAINAQGLTIDSWRKENVDWTIYSTLQELAASTSKYTSMDGPWSLKFLKEYVTDNSTLMDPTDNYANFISYFDHLNLDDIQKSGAIEYFSDIQTSSFLSSLEGIQISSYVILPDGSSLSQFSNGDVIARAKGWPCGIQIQSSACNNLVFDCSTLDANALSDIDEMLQCYSNCFIAKRLPGDNTQEYTIYKYDNSSLVKSQGSSTVSFVQTSTCMSSSNGKWICVLANMQLSSSLLSFDYYSYDRVSGKSSLYPKSVSIPSNSSSFILERFRGDVAIGYETTDGTWGLSILETNEDVSISQTFSWATSDQISASNILAMSTNEDMRTFKIGQIVSGEIDGKMNYFTLPLTDSQTQLSAVNFKDIDIQYGPYYKSYRPWDNISLMSDISKSTISFAQYDGYVKAMYPCLEHIMDGFDFTSLHSLGVDWVSQHSSIIAPEDVLMSDIGDITLDIDIIKIPTNTFTINEIDTKSFEYVTIYKEGIVLDPQSETVDDQANLFLDYNQATNTVTTGIEQECLFVNDMIYDFNLNGLSSTQTSTILTIPFGPLKSTLDSDWGLDTSFGQTGDVEFSDFRHYKDIKSFYAGFFLQYRQYASGTSIVDEAGNKWFLSNAPSFDFYSLECVPSSTRSISSSSKMSNSNLFSVEIENSNLTEEQKNYLQPKLMAEINNLRGANMQLLDIVWKGN